MSVSCWDVSCECSVCIIMHIVLLFSYKSQTPLISHYILTTLFLTPLLSQSTHRAKYINCLNIIMCVDHKFCDVISLTLLPPYLCYHHGLESCSPSPPIGFQVLTATICLHSRILVILHVIYTSSNFPTGECGFI